MPAVSAFFAAIMSVQPIALTPDETARLQKGDVVTHIEWSEKPGGAISAAIDIPAPPKEIWQAMVDCPRAERYVPKLERCTVLAADPDGLSDLRETKARFLPMLPRLTLRFRSWYEPFRVIRFAKDGGDLAIMEGAWLLEPISDGPQVRTRVHYQVRMAPKTPVPRAMVREGLKRDTPLVLQALRQDVARHYTAKEANLKAPSGGID